ncbi:MAG: hypothetical protein HY076_05720 [Candidatus Eisenbacteria bacterium]|uniref:Uncharacterized protein n=1 Tax=Eiseniibacteriota bacterium TaxID=2212470 RepID=A0A9D6QIS8_UNCEI|nr:hypothetical protein [Candidatus Eisenbacteria bacterium]MBI3539752.1 hypothetical protein [Candidatus Eisenbacteria bacterium]
MHDRDDELTAAEERAYAELAREAMPSRMLEERVVSELRARGVLGWRTAQRHGWRRLQTATAAAASFALFASGLAVGQWLGARHTADAMLKLQRQDSATAAAAVQRTGSAYLSALGALAQASSSADPKEVARARQAAQSVLHQAADEMVRLAPDDPVSAQILKGLDRAQVQATTASTRPDKQHFVWF